MMNSSWRWEKSQTLLLVVILLDNYGDQGASTGNYNFVRRLFVGTVVPSFCGENHGKPCKLKTVFFSHCVHLYTDVETSS